MWRRLGVRAAVILALFVCAQTPMAGIPGAATPALAQGGAAFCAPGQPAQFMFGIAALRDRLGSPMGDPVECEHVDAASGDTIQRTTTGLAYFRPSLSLAIFTNGETHWTLANNQLLLWRSDSVTPPEPTPTEAEYLNRTAPIRSRFANLQGRLDAMRRQASAGQLDSVDVAALTGLVDELRATRDAYAAARGASRLFKYHGSMVTAVNAAMGSAEMLAQARQLQASDARTTFLAKATTHRQESERFQSTAADAYSRTLPIVVN